MTTLAVIGGLLALVGVLIFFYVRAARREDRQSVKLEASEDANKSVADKVRRDDRIADDPGLAKRLRDRFYKK